MGHVLDAESHVRCAVSGCESYYGISYGRGPSSRSISLLCPACLCMMAFRSIIAQRQVWVDGREQAESSQTPPISNKCRLVCVSVSGAPGGRLCFAFFFYYSSAAGVGVVSPCVGLGLACLSSSWRLQTRAGRNGVPVAISPTGSEMTVGD